jgi:hypothetical protein
MDQYCKHILTKYSRGGSILQVCSEPGMPSIAVVKKWLFNKEYNYEYAGFREGFLRIQNNMLHCYHDDLHAKQEALYNITGNNEKERNANYRKASKEHRDFYMAVQWFNKHIELLAKLYDHHARGLDFPIEGIHFDAIISPPPTNVLQTPSSKVSIWDKLSNLDFGNINLNFSFKIYSSITRAEAEEILGTPLLYGRIHKRTSQKTTPQNERRGVLHTPSLHTPSLDTPIPQTPGSHISNYKHKPCPPGLIGTKYETLYYPQLLHYDFDTSSILNLSSAHQDDAPNRKSILSGGINQKLLILNPQLSIRNSQFIIPSLINSS